MRQINESSQLELFKSPKKIILFIVDGNHDEAEISVMLKIYCPEFLEKYKPMFLALDESDITAEEKSTKDNIVGKITNQLINWRLKSGHQYVIYPSDIARIIHIIDTDGAFITSEAITEYNGRIYYTDTEIKTREVKKTKKRNERKTAIVERLLNTSYIDNIPYSIWFVSCNMDHLLFNNRNPKTPIEKRNGADRFRVLCKTPEYLAQSVFADGIRAEGTYTESWDFIRKDFNSLHRHCNINLLLDEFKTEAQR